MGNVCSRCVRRKTKYKDKVDLLTEKAKKIINTFLSKDLYENELKFKRPSAEVKCITDGVKTIVEQLMVAVGDKEPLLEISHQYLVGSMAERTRIGEPDEFDFLVVLRHFSKPGSISFHNDGLNHYYVFNENIDPSLYRKRGSVFFNNERNLQFKNLFISNILKDFISSIPEPLYVGTYHGRLTINSTTVCHHGPASVVKLLWEPKSKISKPLDILVDITQRIKQSGRHRFIGSDTREKVIPDRNKSHILNNDTFMLIPTDFYFDATITTIEANIVKSFSSHHKTCYMILKYCFNTIVHNVELYGYYTLLPSYYIKTSIIRHVMKCESAENGQHETEDCLFTCLTDITDDLNDSVCKFDVVGSFKKQKEIHQSKEFTIQVIDNVVQRLVKIGKEANSGDIFVKFRKACHKTYTHAAIQIRTAILDRNKVECHLSLKCKIHENCES